MKTSLKGLFKLRPIWWLLAIMLVAVFFRFWQLNTLPPGLHPDEAANGLDIVLRILKGDLRVLYDTNGPREALFFYLQTPFVLLLKNTILALRLAPAIIGTAAVLVTYLWAKEWFNQKVALFSAFFYAVGVWAVTLSRDGYRANLTPLFIALNVWLTTKLIQTRKWYWAVLAGISYGAGLYSYFSYRLIILAGIAIFLMALVKHRDVLKEIMKPLAMAALSAAIVLVPLGIYAIDHPADVISGRSSTAFTNPELNHGQPAKTLIETAGKTALMFNIKGDPNYRHNLGGAPMLDAATGIFFVLGLLLCLRRIKNIRYFALLAIFGSMLLPEMVTAEGIPHGLRAIGVLPVVYIMAGLGLWELISRFLAVFPKNVIAKGFLYGSVSLLLLMTAAYSYQRYFVAWANAPETFEAYSEDAVQAAEFLNQNDYSGPRYLVIGGYSDQTVAYLTNDKSHYQRVEPDGSNVTLSADVPAQVVVLESELAKFEPTLRKLGAKLQMREVRSDKRPGVTLFRVYEIQN